VKPPTSYTFVGALEPLTKGSGLATVCVAIYLTERKTPCPLDMGIEASPFKVAWEVGFPS
jgi:hypothetical protein